MPDCGKLTFTCDRCGESYDSDIGEGCLPHALLCLEFQHVVPCVGCGRPILKPTLDRAGHLLNCATAGDVAEAIERVKRHPKFQPVLLDLVPKVVAA